MWRILNIALVVVLVMTAAIVYDVKYTSTYEAQKVARLDAEIRVEREKIATLKAEWSQLAAPDRIQRLAARYLGMKPLPIAQIGSFASLPERTQTSSDPIGDIIEGLPGGKRDPIGNILDKLDSAKNEQPEITGSIGMAEPETTEPVTINGILEAPDTAGLIDQDAPGEPDGKDQ
jgi:cell division protein FtsL